MRDDARVLLERECGQCHISSYPTSLPKALAVFDLLDEDWSRKMSDAQLKDALSRLAGAHGADGELPAVPERDHALFAKFVDAEIARRGH